jgi:hypothetical protein
MPRTSRPCSPVRRCAPAEAAAPARMQRARLHLARQPDVRQQQAAADQPAGGSRQGRGPVAALQRHTRLPGLRHARQPLRRRRRSHSPHLHAEEAGALPGAVHRGVLRRGAGQVRAVPGAPGSSSGGSSSGGGGLLVPTPAGPAACMLSAHVAAAPPPAHALPCGEADGSSAARWVHWGGRRPGPLPLCRAPL